MSLSPLQDFVQNGLEGKSATTIRTYQHALKQFAEWLDGSGTDLLGYARSDVQDYINWLTQKKKSAATINKVWNAIKTYSRWANKLDAIRDIRVVKAIDYTQQAPQAIPKNDRNRVIREIERSGNKRDFAIIMTLLYTGVRVSELVSLDKEDIEMSERKGEVTILGKGNKVRTVPLNAEVRRALEDYLSERTDNDPALFLSNRQKRISVRMVQTIIEKHGFHAHQFRHTFITGLVRSGQDLSVIQSLSGHSSADMVLRYSKPTEEDKQNAIESLHF